MRSIQGITLAVASIEEELQALQRRIATLSFVARDVFLGINRDLSFDWEFDDTSHRWSIVPILVCYAKDANEESKIDAVVSRCIAGIGQLTNGVLSSSYRRELGPRGMTYTLIDDSQEAVCQIIVSHRVTEA